MSKKLQQNMQTNMKHKNTMKKSIMGAIIEGNMALKLSRHLKIHIWI